MPTVHISETELARDLHSVLEKVREGVEIIIEQDRQPIAVLKSTTTAGPGRSAKDCIALARAYEKRLGEAPIPDEDFARDVQAGIDARRDPFESPEWD